MVLLTSTEGIVGKQFQSYDMHLCDFSSPAVVLFSSEPHGARGKVKNEIMQINGKKGGEIFFFTRALPSFLVDLSLTPCVCSLSTTTTTTWTPEGGQPLDLSTASYQPSVQQSHMIRMPQYPS